MPGGETWASVKSGGGRYLYYVAYEEPFDGWAVGEDGIIMHFFCPNIGDTGGCGFFDIESVADDITTAARIVLCSGKAYIVSWEIR